MKKEKTQMHILPTYVADDSSHLHTRRFHFWEDIIPYSIWKLEKELSFDLHHGSNLGKIYKSMRERIASKLDPQTKYDRNINHG
tara:strand:- start:2434 stop:2685 length:252 start_codon:yes stop_codon:yes gene_type:complete